MKICIFGQLNNGKTSYAHMLHQELLKLTDTYFYLASWARGVKASVCNKFQLSFDFVEHWKNKKEIPPGFNLTMREILQLEGESARQAKTTVWIDKLMSEYATVNLIIDDGRYPNEAEAVYKDNGYNILIIRPECINTLSHPSECKIGGVVNALKGKTDVPPEWAGLLHEVVMNSSDLDSLRKDATVTAKNIVDFIKRNKK